MDILVVEDNPGDVRIMQEALRSSRHEHILHIARDGVEAMEFLGRTGAHTDAPVPDLILMDINMPRKNGFEVLEAMQEDADLARIPVVILTTSEAGMDIKRCYDLRANSFVAKPVDLDRFIEVVRQIETFWMGTATLPGDA